MAGTIAEITATRNPVATRINLNASMGTAFHDPGVVMTRGIARTATTNGIVAAITGRSHALTEPVAGESEDVVTTKSTVPTEVTN